MLKRVRQGAQAASSCAEGARLAGTARSCSHDADPGDTSDAETADQQGGRARVGLRAKPPASGAAVASGALATLAATVAFATPSATPTCGQLQALRDVFPKAATVGFTGRDRVARSRLRSPIWPGTCGKWYTGYRRGSTRLRVSLTLYRTHEQALVALAEPAFGPVQNLSNGARVRQHLAPVSVDGVMRQFGGVASVYRNVFISSGSIADEPVSLQAQNRVHRRIHTGVSALR